MLELALGPVNTGAGAGPGTPSRGEQSLLSTRRRLVLGRSSQAGAGIAFLRGRSLGLVCGLCVWWMGGIVRCVNRSVNRCRSLG